MPIRIKVVLSVLAISFVPILLLYLFSYQILLKTFTNIEKNLITEDVTRVERAFNQELTQLVAVTGEYSNWDDTYTFAQDLNQSYIDTYVTSDNLGSSGTNLFVIVDKTGAIVFSKYLDPSIKELTELPKSLAETLLNNSQNLLTTTLAKSGFLRYDDQDVMFAARPILKSSFQGPVLNVLIMGKVVDFRTISKVQSVTNLNIAYYKLQVSEPPIDSQILKELNTKNLVIDTTKQEQLDSYSFLKDINGAKLGIIHITKPRNIFSEGAKVLSLILLGAIIISLINVMGSSLLLDWGLVKKLKMILIKVEEVTKSNNFAIRIPTYGKDEVGKLASKVNILFESLEASDKYQRIINKELASKSLDLENKTNELQKINKTIEKTVLERTKELNDEKARLLTFINSVPYGFVMTNRDQSIFLVNSVINPILRINEHKWTVQKIEQAIGTNWKLAENIENSMTNRRIIMLDNIDYKNRIIKVTLAPIITGHLQTTNVIGCMIVLEDRTEDKIVQRSKEEFFSIASHELRTPLSVIKGNAQLIKRYYSEQVNNKDFSEMIDDIDNASVRLIGLVNDFLTTSKLEQNRVSFIKENFDVADLIIETLNELNTLAEQKKIDLIMTQSKKPIPMITADKMRAKEVLINLIGNAIKFTEKGAVKVSISAMPDNLQAKVSVTDTGRGISPQNQNLLFRKFQQASDNIYTRDTEKGTGLGLYISKMIIEGQGGKIFLEKSEEGKGSTFCFTLPFVKNTPKL